VVQQLTFEAISCHSFGWRVDGRGYSVEHFGRDDARLLARLFQRWIPEGLGLDRVRWVPDGNPVELAAGSHPHRFGAPPWCS
jgi:hypothetical protein